MREKLVAFLTSPSRETYLAIREEVVGSSQYAPYSQELDSADQLLDAGEHMEALQRITETMPNLLLSPRAHYLLCRIARALNDHKTAESELRNVAVCLAGILMTGDGSHEKPYVVVRVDDEYDVINQLGKQRVGQSLIQEEEKFYDLLRLEDGSELWFDITEAFRRSQEPVNAVYRVRLSHVGSSRVKVLALIREIWGLTPADAKSLVDSSRPILGTIESKHWNDVQKKFWDVGAVLDFE
jgi:Domain of unknown function (DUF4919)/Ribosomal protein L7/L12 C-terminal domain